MVTEQASGAEIILPCNYEVCNQLIERESELPTCISNKQQQ